LTPFIFSKQIKPLLKRKVKNETFFMSLRLYYQIYYYILLYAVYILYLDVDTTRNIDIHKCLYIYKVGMPPPHLLIFRLIPAMSKLLKSHAVDYRRLKTSREENLTKHVGFLYAYVKKAKE